MLTALFALGYSARQIAQPYLTKSRELPTRPWHMAPGPWAAESLRTFPSKTAYHAYHRLRTRPEVVAAAESRSWARSRRRPACEARPVLRTKD